MKKILVLSLSILPLIINAQYPPVCTNTSTLTIVTYDPGDCGVVSDETRDIPDIEDLVEAMDSTGAYELGTGFIYEYNHKKYVITCGHVLYKAGRIIAFDSSYERKYELKLVGTDMFFDIAVLEFVCQDDTELFEGFIFDDSESNDKAIQSLGYWKWNGELSIEEGQILPQNTQGKQSELSLPEMGYIESDARTAGGFSGGPIINTKGQVVGMNNAVNTKEKTSYALGSRTVERLVHDIIDHGKIQRIFLGIEFAQAVDRGPVIINKIINKTPAAKRYEDLINREVTSINGQSVSSIYDVLMIMEEAETDKMIILGLANGHEIPVQSEPLDEHNLEKIADHAVRKYGQPQHAKIKIGEDNILRVVAKREQYIVKTAGIGEAKVYCLNSQAQLGLITRMFALHGYIELGKDDSHIYIEEIKFSEDKNKRILYY